MISASDNTFSDTNIPALPAPRFHPFARLLIATIGALLITLIVSLAIIAALTIAATLSGENPETKIDRFFSDNLLQVNLFVYPPVLLWLWFCRRCFDRRTFVSLGLRMRGILPQLAAGIAGGFLAVALIFGVLWLSGNLQIRGISAAAQSGGTGNSLLLLGGWALMMICVGGFEEIAFRGYAFHNLRIWLGTRAANVLQAIVFALIHLGNLAAQDTSTPDANLAALLAMPNIFLIGIFFTVSYLKTGSLWFPIAFHAAWNFFLGCVFSLPVSGLPIFQFFDVSVSGSTPLTGGAFGPEASLLLTPILLVLIYVTSRLADAPQAVADLQSLQITNLKTPPESQTFPLDETELTEEARENRFKTRMGKRATDLDIETRDVLRELSQSRRQTPAPASTPAMPIVVPPAPVQVETPQLAIETSSETPGEIPTKTPPEIPTEQEAAKETPAALPAQKTSPPPARKPTPRW